MKTIRKTFLIWLITALTPGAASSESRAAAESERAGANGVLTLEQVLREVALNNPRLKAARANWEKQSFTNKKEMARAITEVRQEETRLRRLAKVMDVLKNGKKCRG